MENSLPTKCQRCGRLIGQFRYGHTPNEHFCSAACQMDETIKPTFYFSNLQKTWHWLNCALCNKDIALVRDKPEYPNDVLCSKCYMGELKVEAMIARPQDYGI